VRVKPEGELLMRKIFTALFLPLFFAMVLVLGFYFFTRLGFSIAYNNAMMRRRKRMREKPVQKNPIVN
jgi:hypothetical protein